MQALSQSKYSVERLRNAVQPPDDRAAGVGALTKLTTKTRSLADANWVDSPSAS